MKNLDDILGSIAGDPEKAEVLKEHIKQTEETKRAQANSEDFQATRWLALAAVVLVALFASCVGYRAVDAWEKVHTPVVPTVPVVAPTPTTTDTHR